MRTLKSPQAGGQRTTEQKKFYRGGVWKKIRLKVLRGEPLCRRCQHPASEVDHIDGDWRNNPGDGSNYQPLCFACHVIKTKEDRQRHKTAKDFETEKRLRLAGLPPESGED